MIISLFSILIGLGFFVFIIRRVQLRKFPERESILWLFFGAIMVTLAIFPNLIMVAAQWLGISYAPTLLFLLSIVVLTYMIIRKEEKISDLQTKVQELAKRQALMEHELKKK